MDPLAELTPSISPYAYCKGNPVRFIDPTGMYSTEEWKEDNGITDSDLTTVYKSPDENNKQVQETGDQLEAIKNSYSGLYNQIQTCAAAFLDIFTQKKETTLPDGKKTISYETRDLAPDYVSVDLSGSAFIPFVPAVGGGFDLSLGYVRNDGLFLLGGTRVGAGYDFSISGGLSLGVYSGKAPLSATSLSGEGLHLTLGVGLVSYSLLQDISNQYGNTRVGSNWTINSISVGVGLTPANVSITKSNSFNPYYLFK